MEHELFPKRHKLRLSPDSLAHEHVPKPVRFGLYQVLERCFHNGYIGDSHLYTNICAALGIKDDIRPETRFGLSSEDVIQTRIKHLLLDSESGQFYRICEIISKSIDPYRGYDPLIFSKEVNALFINGNLAFRLKNHAIVKVGNNAVQDKLRGVREFLAGPEFEDARDQLNKAAIAIDIQPNPNYCIRFTLAATESICRLVFKREADEFNTPFAFAVEKMAGDLVPKHIKQSIKNLFDYGAHLTGNAEGSSAFEIDIDEVEFVVATSVAIIIYLVKKKGDLPWGNSRLDLKWQLDRA